MNETGETEGNEGVQPRASRGVQPSGRRVERQPLSSDGTVVMPGMDQSRFMAGLLELYKTVLSESTPTRMVELIEQIKEKESKSK